MSDEYLISAPPPPEVLEVPESGITVLEVPGEIVNLSGKEISSKKLTLSFDYDREALLITPTLNHGSNVFELKSCKVSPKVGLFKVAVLNKAKAGKTYPVSLSLHDKEGGQSNTVKLYVIARRAGKSKNAAKSLLSKPTTMLLLVAGLVGLAWIAAEVSKQRNSG